jgi:hypothetical protein
MATNPPPKQQWFNFFGRYVAPTVIASFIASLISIYTAVNAHNKELRDYGTQFEQSLTAESVMAAFKGSDVAEEKAAADLLALQSLAVTSEQRRSVLLLGGRLLNANTNVEATGQAAARLLTILIDEDESDHDRESINLVESASFLNLVTAGYANDYYNDNYSQPNYIWTTLNGDQPITHDAKLQLLLSLTPKKYDGWIHVETLATDYAFDRKPAISHATAENFAAAISTVSMKRDMSHAGNTLAEYVILPHSASGASAVASDGYVQSSSLLETMGPTTSLLLLKARLLRDRPPVEYVNPDGTFFRGSLGRITGVVPPGACIQLAEPAQPILVFVPSHQLTPVQQKTTNLTNPELEKWIGLIHIWIHVRPSSDCGAF